MAFREITALQDSSFEGPNGRVSLVWNHGAEGRINATLHAKQRVIDSEVLRLCAPLVPHRTGTLERSGTLGTVIGSGEVRYITPYARAQYYNTAQTRSYDPRRGGRWFERMKTANRAQLERLLNQE
jgi:hypothetical protein